MLSNPDPTSPADLAAISAAAVRQLDAARIFVAAARRFGARAAVRAGDEQRSYADLLDRTARLAAAFTALGVRRGDRVALLLPNGIRFIEAWWAAVRAGGVAMPINPRASAVEVRAMLDDAGGGRACWSPTPWRLAWPA